MMGVSGWPGFGRNFNIGFFSGIVKASCLYILVQGEKSYI